MFCNAYLEIPLDAASIPGECGSAFAQRPMNTVDQAKEKLSVLVQAAKLLREQ